MKLLIALTIFAAASATTAVISHTNGDTEGKCNFVITLAGASIFADAGTAGTDAHSSFWLAKAAAADTVTLSLLMSTAQATVGTIDGPGATCVAKTAKQGAATTNDLTDAEDVGTCVGSTLTSGTGVATFSDIDPAFLAKVWEAADLTYDETTGISALVATNVVGKWLATDGTTQTVTSGQATSGDITATMVPGVAASTRNMADVNVGCTQVAVAFGFTSGAFSATAAISAAVAAAFF